MLSLNNKLIQAVRLAIADSYQYDPPEIRISYTENFLTEADFWEIAKPEHIRMSGDILGYITTDEIKPCSKDNIHDFTLYALSKKGSFVHFDPSADRYLFIKYDYPRWGDYLVSAILILIGVILILVNTTYSIIKMKNK
ncbi:hypothetical protein [Cohnella laeviribosi]|uniref:hypothetical protein n=1 Tax=Cohnella laeviribosi TaxID=380174 RepID=UPI0003659A04|nr:hypothetical protein [Cohnella laeviribosi]